MTEKIFETADPEILRSNAFNQLEDMAESFDKKRVDLMGLYMTANNVWRNMNKNLVLHEKFEKAMRQQRMAVHQMATIDVSRGDPIHKRYDPEEWIKKIPAEFENCKDVYIRDKVQSLLNLIKIIGLNE